MSLRSVEDHGLSPTMLREGFQALLVIWILWPTGTRARLSTASDLRPELEDLDLGLRYKLRPRSVSNNVSTIT